MYSDPHFKMQNSTKIILSILLPPGIYVNFCLLSNLLPHLWWHVKNNKTLYLKLKPFYQAATSQFQPCLPSTLYPEATTTVNLMCILPAHSTLLHTYISIHNQCIAWDMLFKCVKQYLPLCIILQLAFPLKIMFWKWSMLIYIEPFHFIILFVNIVTYMYHILFLFSIRPSSFY